MDKYKIESVPQLWLESYTQHKNIKTWMFKLENLYFMKTSSEKLNKINEVMQWNFVIYDTETNGINNFWESLPFQIAAKKYRNFKLVDEMNVLLNIWEIPEFILELTNFKQEDIDNWISLKEWLDEFLKFIKWEKYIIAHNAWFDVSIINNAMVYTNTYIQYNVNVLCSMQMYYTLYKHVFELWITGSSLDQLSVILLWLSINEENRHQADYDILLTFELLYKFKEDIEYDISLWENSMIKRVLNIEDHINDKIYMLYDINQREKSQAYIHEIWAKISQLYSEYYEEYYYTNLEISEAISKFIWDNEVLLKEELNNKSYFIRKNKPFLHIDEDYAKTYTSTTNIIENEKWYKVDFFVEDPKVGTDIEIKDPEMCYIYIDKFVRNKHIMMQLQMKIKHMLKMINVFHNITGYTRFWNDENFLKITKIRKVWIIERTISPENIIYDINKWLINSIDDLYSKTEDNTKLLIEENIYNKIKDL